MAGALRRLPLLGTTQVVLAAAIFLFVCGSSSVPELLRVGPKARWAALLVLLVLSTVLAAVRRGRRMPSGAPVAWIVALAVLAPVSAAWSVDPKLTIERAVSFDLVLASGLALSVALAHDEHGLAALLDAILASVTAICIAGAVLYVFRPDQAAQPGSVEAPLRFKGLGQNPNTVSLLAAVALPLALFLLRSPSRTRRAAGAASAAVLLATIVASGSRGALGGAAAGMLLAAALLWCSRARLVAVIAVLVAVAGGAAIDREALGAMPAAAPASGPAVPGNTKTGGGAGDSLPSLQDEIGSPVGAEPRRTFFGSSGRFAAWGGAIGQGAKRPLLGSGFGTEDRVFVDRYYTFQGARPENSYIGLFLQLGAVGAALFLGVGVALLVALVRSLRRTTAGSGVVVAAAAAVLAGYVLALSQSYVYAAGNVATISFWVCAFAVVATTLGQDREDAPENTVANAGR